MDFTLRNNGLRGSAQQEIENDVLALELEIKNLQAQLDAVDASVDSVIAEIAALKTKDVAIITSIDNLVVRSNLSEEKLNSLSALVNTKKLTAESASIQEAVISKADITELNVAKPITTDIVNSSISTKTATSDKITSQTAELDNIVATDVKVNGTLNINTIDSTEVNAIDIKSTNNVADKITVNEKMTFNGINIKSIDVRASGIDNMHLHKLAIKADGILVIKLTNSSIVVNANNVTSNYNGLYASYIENGETVLYISQDIDCQALVIGEATIKTSTVLKTSIRRNADNNGNPNTENIVKVAVVDKLPVIGQRNIIYVVLGDCAYYCDGQYFYEMAAKKRG